MHHPARRTLAHSSRALPRIHLPFLQVLSPGLFRSDCDWTVRLRRFGQLVWAKRCARSCAKPNMLLGLDTSDLNHYENDAHHAAEGPQALPKFRNVNPPPVSTTCVCVNAASHVRTSGPPWQLRTALRSLGTTPDEPSPSPHYETSPMFTGDTTSDSRLRRMIFLIPRTLPLCLMRSPPDAAVRRAR